MLRNRKLNIKQAIKSLEPEKTTTQQVVKSSFEKAVDVANEHSNLGLSRFYFIEMLEEEEGFSHDEAVYGVDNCSINWRDEAVIAAKELMHMLPGASEDEIRFFLIQVCMFTGSEAAYGCRKVFC